jgi:hypothetical protein
MTHKLFVQKKGKKEKKKDKVHMAMPFDCRSISWGSNPPYSYKQTTVILLLNF